ncbi:MAG: 1-acyl-sn-glycerol-3-phosphate acyltransferase, partial [Bradyrhizobium sp.]
RREGLYLRWPLPFYASREDMLRRGFLAAHLSGWPRPLRALIGTISLAGFFRIVRAEPMRRIPEYTLGEAFAELAQRKDASRESWLNARGRRESANGASPPRIGDDMLTRFWGLRRLNAAARKALAPEFRATIAAQLAGFAERLDAGRVVYLAPEGTISRDGRLGRIRAGPWRLARLAAAPPPILPAALSYDPLGPGRLRVIVRVGTPLGEYDTNDRRRFDAMLEKEIRTLYPVNASHLISRFLVVGPDRFTAEDFARWFARAVATVTDCGLTTDPLLSRRVPAMLAAERFAWLAKKGFIERDGEAWRNRWPRDVEPGWRRPAEIVRYLDNALADLVQALAPGLADRIKP